MNSHSAAGRRPQLPKLPSQLPTKLTTKLPQQPHQPHNEHSVPWFWPMAAAMESGEEGMRLFADNLRFVNEALAISLPQRLRWATANRIALDLPTMRLRDFRRAQPPAPIAGAAPGAVLIAAPYAGHSATIADFGAGQSLVATLQQAGLHQVFVTDLKSATPAMKDFGIDHYLADLAACVTRLGGHVTLVGLCQGGWLSAMYAARFGDKVDALVLAGAPIDTEAGDGAVKRLAHSLPLHFNEELVRLGGGRMRGVTMQAGWKNLQPQQQYLGKYLELYRHIEDRNYIDRTEAFERRYETTLDLPGVYYLQAISWLFKENRLFKGTYMGLGARLCLGDIVCPVYLLAGTDDTTTPEQVFNARDRLGTAPRRSASSAGWRRATISACSWTGARWTKYGPILPGGCLTCALPRCALKRKTAAWSAMPALQAAHFPPAAATALACNP